MHDRIEIVRFTCGPFEENPYLLVGPSGQRAALVDPGIGSEPILEAIRSRGLTLHWILNTHGHLDHAGANAFFKERTGAPLAIHAADVPMILRLSRQAAMFGLEASDSPPPDVLLVEGEAVELDGVPLDVIHTPGHTPGGVCLRFGGRMLVGDTLFQGSVGRTDLPGGSWPTLVASIREKLFRLPDEVVCFPGHGPETTVGDERRTNPFVSDSVAAGDAP